MSTYVVGIKPQYADEAPIKVTVTYKAKDESGLDVEREKTLKVYYPLPAVTTDEDLGEKALKNKKKLMVEKTDMPPTTPRHLLAALLKLDAAKIQAKKGLGMKATGAAEKEK